jgi:hypothetical protein
VNSFALFQMHCIFMWIVSEGYLITSELHHPLLLKKIYSYLIKIDVRAYISKKLIFKKKKIDVSWRSLPSEKIAVVNFVQRSNVCLQ